MGMEFSADYVHSELASHFLQDEAGRASDIQDAANGKRVAANGADHEASIAKPSMDAGDIAIRSRD
jgi:hypothetical protein